MTKQTAGPVSVRAALTDRGFLLHYLQMVAAMLVGMIALTGPLSLPFDRPRPEIDALVMATAMSIGMVAWMAWRRHRLRDTVEMVLVMYLSFVALFPLLWLGAVTAAGMLHAGHMVMLPAMALVMLWRRESYVGHRRDRR